MRFAVKFCLFSGGALSAHKFMPTSGRSNVSALLVYNLQSKATQSILRFLDSRRQIRSPWSEYLGNGALRPRLRKQKNDKIKA